MRKVPQRLLTRPSYLASALPFLSIAPVRCDYLLGNFGHICSGVLRNEHGNAKSPNCRSLSRSFHGSIYSKEEHRDISFKDWKNHLQTFEQYQHQSDLGQESSQGPRLLDQPRYNTDFELWLELVLFRRRQQDTTSLGALYRQIIVRGLHLPTTGDTADGLWNNFLYLGWETNNLWKDVVPYARRLQAETGRSWQPFYAKNLLHSLKSAPQYAAKWHGRLREKFKPSSADMKDIFKKTVSSESTLEVFRRMYIEFKIRDMYSTVIPQLCNEEKYNRAVEWHHLMMMKKDRPPNANVAEPLVRHLARYGETYQLLCVTTSMTEAGVPVTTSTNGSLESTKATTREILNRQLGNLHNISPEGFSDEFCGRLFATPAFSTRALVKGLHMLGVDRIGPISLRELVLREFVSRKRSSHRPISQCLDELREAGVSIDESTFCTVVSNLAVQGDERLLEEVVNCDMHPDVFEDEKLQESLLSMYYAQGDYQQADRTLAILTAKCKSGNLQSTRLNLLLRSALKRQDLTNIHRLLDLMQEKMVSVSAKSVQALQRGLLSRREVSKPPASVAELPNVIAVYQRILRTGGYLDISHWGEILRRLGMTGSLIDLEKVSLWLAQWYSNPKFRASESSFFKQTSEQIPEDLPVENPRHPLRILFPAALQQAFVAWGFQHSGDFHRTPRYTRNKVLTWRWGVELLRELKRRKVPILKRTVSRACRLRLIAVFKRGQSRRLINRGRRRLNMNQIMSMAQEMEKIWGSDFFIHISHRFPPGDPRRFAILQQQVFNATTSSAPMKLSVKRAFKRSTY